MALFTQELVSAAKRIKGDIYVGHNLAALPAVIAASRVHHVTAM
jgi:hypothetical protein